MNRPSWRYVADGELPDGYEECLVEDAFGHRFVAEFCDRLIIDYDKGKDCVREEARNVFISKLGRLPNEVVRWVPMKEIVIVTEVKEEK
jgi:hypothetical protein